MADHNASSETYPAGQEIPGTRCTVEYVLGEGGYGSVLRCRHVVLKRKVVLKLMLASHRGRGDLVERMMAEAQALAQLDHANIALIHDAGMTTEEVPRPFLTLQYYPGETLAQALQAMPRGRGIGLLPALDLAIELCDALRAAHERGIIHRDVKPANIYLARTPEGRTVTKVIDFGIAHFKEATTRATGRMYLGTPRYSAPEQIQGLPPSARTDLYAVGLVLYDCLCGRGPFDPAGENLESNEMMRAHLERTPAPLSAYWTDVPEELEALVAALVAKKPEERPPNASLVSIRLREIKARVLAMQAPALAHFDPNRTEPTPFDNRQMRYSADTQRDPPSANEAATAHPMRTTQRMDSFPPVGPAGTMRLPLAPMAPAFEQPTANSEPVDRDAATPSMEPQTLRGPTHGTEEGEAPDDFACLQEAYDDLYSDPLSERRGGATPSAVPAAGTLSNAPAILSVRPAVSMRRDGMAARVAAAAAGLATAVALSVAIWSLRHTPGSGPGSPAAAAVGAATGVSLRAGGPRKTATLTPTASAAALAPAAAQSPPLGAEPSAGPPASVQSAASAPSPASPASAQVATTQGTPVPAPRPRATGRLKSDPLLELKRSFSSSPPAAPDRAVPAF